GAVQRELDLPQIGLEARQRRVAQLEAREQHRELRRDARELSAEVVELARLRQRVGRLDARLEDERAEFLQREFREAAALESTFVRAKPRNRTAQRSDRARDAFVARAIVAGQIVALERRARTR